MEGACYNYDVNKLLPEIGKEKLIDLIEDYSVDRWDEYGERMSFELFSRE